MTNVTLTQESIDMVLNDLDDHMDGIKKEEKDLCFYKTLDSGVYEEHKAYIEELKSYHNGVLTGIRLLLRRSESITIDGKICFDASITYNDVTGKHEFKGL